MSRQVGESRMGTIAINATLVLLAVISLAPIAWMVSVSFMPTGEASHFPPPLLPSSVTLRNYHELFERTGMARNFANSLLVSVAITALSLLVNTMAGYAFAKLRFAGRERIFQLLLAALVIPAQVAMLPLFLMMKQLHLVNNYQFEAELRPGAAAGDIFMQALMGANPLLAPGILALAGVLAIAATYYDPALSRQLTITA